MTAADFAQKLEATATGEGKWKARCPAHEDNRASLSIGIGDDGRVLLKCHAGCANEAVVTALGLSMRDLMPERPAAPPAKGKGALGRVVATYDYRNEAGAPLFQVVRYDPKDFRQRHRTTAGRWSWSMQGVRRVLYRLPEVLAAVTAGEPVYIVEGEKDANALVGLGLCATCNSGGAGKFGAHSREYLKSLRGVRLAIIIADKDGPGRAHAATIADFLHHSATPVRVLEAPVGKDASDWIAAGGTRKEIELLAEATPTWTPASGGTTQPSGESAGARHASNPYESTPEGIIWHKETRDGPVPVSLCNFTAKIVADVTEDDGVETQRAFESEGSLYGQTRRFPVSASRFRALDWAIEHLGASAVISPGFGAREHLSVAVQLLSGKIPPRTRYTHTGWRKIGGPWLYLHGGGAIGPIGPVPNIEVELTGTLQGYVLPAPPTGDELIKAILASLDLLDLGPHLLTVPVYGAIWRAALHSADFSLHLSGETGVFKSELAALGQQHFGTGLDARHLPGAWTSTDNALESMASAVADAIFTVDDFCPTGSSYEVQRLHAKADRIFRGQGNSAGRQRMRADTTLRPSRPPRGLIVSTGEDTPGGQSLRARLCCIEVERGAINIKRLTECQRAAAAGLYAAAMSGFIQWVAGRRDALLAAMRERLPELRQRATSSGAAHRRTPAIVADLYFGLETFTAFAVEVAALDAAGAKVLMSQCWIALGEAAAAQARGMTESEPAGRFLGLLSSALVSGRAHVAAVDGGPPEAAGGLGWRRDAQSWVAVGRRIGWTDGEKLYLERDAAVAAANEVGQATGSPLLITPGTLAKRLNDRGHLLAVEKNRGKLTVRVTIEGVRREVLSLARASLPSTEPAQSAQSVNSQAPDEPEAAGGSAQPAQRPHDRPNETPREDSTFGDIGPIGPVADREREDERSGAAKPGPIGPVPSRESAQEPAHVCRCGERFACPPTPGAGCVCPSCGLPPVHGRQGVRP